MDFNLIIHSKKFNVNDQILKLICHENNVDFIVKSKNNWNFIMSQKGSKINNINNKYLMTNGFFYENANLFEKNFCDLNGQFAITLIENLESTNPEVYVITDWILSKPIYYYFTQNLYFFTTNKNFDFFKLNKMEKSTFWKFSEKKFVKYNENNLFKELIIKRDPETLFNIYLKFQDFNIFYNDLSNCVNNEMSIGILFDQNYPFNSSIIIYIIINYYKICNLDFNNITIIQLSEFEKCEKIPEIINFLENSFLIKLNFHYINKNVKYNKKFDILFTPHFLNEIFLNLNFDFSKLDFFKQFSQLDFIPLFLNKSFIQFTNSLDSTLKRDNYYDINKPPINLYILRKAFEEILPKEIVWDS